MPPRSTRLTSNPETPGSKRKRQASPETTLKIVLPSPSSLQKSSSASPEKIPEDGLDPDPKRQKLSLKINLVTAKPKEVEVKTEVPGALSSELREALSVIIARMAINLPSPLNNILTLWLPPSFAQKEENTLGYVLKQPSLTWEMPCQYPNPVPAGAQFHLPVPPLPSHFPPHIIYNFCASLHSLLLEIEPTNGEKGVHAERWALMQKTPQGGEWFTGAVDAREIEKRKVKEEESLLESMAENGTSFANATAVSLQSTFGGSAVDHKPPTISDSLIRRASLKMNRWKERRAQSGFGGFGSVPRGGKSNYLSCNADMSVTIPQVSSATFTPSFGPTFDSYHTTGGQGYYSTLEGMHERARHREWARRALRRSRSLEAGGYHGTLDTAKGKEKATVDNVLIGNGDLLEELQAWQEIRVRKGVAAVTDREHQVAEELLASLTNLTGSISPADILSPTTSKIGLAHELAQRILPVSSPSIRGTLDPRRPHALHDNITVKPKTFAGQSLGTLSTAPISSPHAPPPIKLNVMPPPPIPQYSAPPPHTLPSGARQSSNYRPNSTPTRGNYPYASSPSVGNTIYSNRQSSTPTPNPSTPGTSSGSFSKSAVGPGPSNLRQSFGPGTPGTPSSNGIVYGVNGMGYKGMMMPGTSR